MKQKDIKQKPKCRATLQNLKERQSALKIASIALVSLILTACSSNRALYKMNLSEVNCAGWFFMAGSAKDTLETKKQIVAHNERYIENCMEKGNAGD